MSDINQNLQHILYRMESAARRAGRSPSEITLVAVSKRKPISDIAQAKVAGQVYFGENFLQDAQGKIAHFREQSVTQQLAWHFIGRIQSNKAKLIADLFDVVETVDRLKIASALQKQLVKSQKILPIYVQVNIGLEEQKAGVLPDDAINFVKQVNSHSNLQVKGLMAMPPYSSNPEETRKYFRQMKELAVKIVEQGILADCGLSMGMSGDYEVAIEEGATLIRVGTALFGEREY